MENVLKVNDIVLLRGKVVDYENGNPCIQWEMTTSSPGNEASVEEKQTFAIGDLVQCLKTGASGAPCVKGDVGKIVDFASRDGNPRIQWCGLQDAWFHSLDDWKKINFDFNNVAVENPPYKVGDVVQCLKTAASGAPCVVGDIGQIVEIDTVDGKPRIQWCERKKCRLGWRHVQEDFKKIDFDRPKMALNTD